MSPALVSVHPVTPPNKKKRSQATTKRHSLLFPPLPAAESMLDRSMTVRRTDCSHSVHTSPSTSILCLVFSFLSAQVCLFPFWLIKQLPQIVQEGFWFHSQIRVIVIIPLYNIMTILAMTTLLGPIIVMLLW